MKCGVVDIGSNAIRAVVYDGEMLSSPVLFHNKFKCDVKELLDQDENNFSHQVYRIFEYFSFFLKTNKVEKVKCVATEVLRKHDKAKNFVKIIKEKYNLDIDILSGQEEANLTALGLISAIGNVNGLGIDFGGGSLELMKINNNAIEKTISISFGTNLDKDSITIEDALQSITDNFSGENFTNLYLAGGTFRMIGRNFMYVMNYQLKVLHNINITIKNFYEYVNIIENDTSLSLKRSQRDAIKIIRTIVDITGASNIIISSYGLKEGVRFQYLLNMGESKKNLIYERSNGLTGFDYESSDAEFYLKILNNLGVSNLELIKETLYLSIIFSRFYFKSGNAIGGVFIYDFIMNSDIPFTEKQRILLITSLCLIFLYSIPYNIKKLCKIYLSDSEYSIANIVGNFIKLSCEIEGTIMYKPNFTLIANGRFIEIQANHTLPAIIYHKTKFHLKELSFFIKKLHQELTD